MVKDWKKIDINNKMTINARIGWQGLTTQEYLKKGRYILITGSDFINNEINYKNINYVSQFRYDQDKKIQVTNGDILITKDGTIGKVAMVKNLNKPATLNSGIFVVRPKITNIDKKFLYYIFCSKIFKNYVQKLLTGSTIKHLNQSQINKFEFIVPKDIKEQKAIADTLTNIDNLIDSLQKIIDKKERIKEGIFAKYFKSNMYKKYIISNIAKIYIDLVTTMTTHYVSNGVPLIRNSDIKENEFLFKDPIYLDNEFVEQNKSRMHQLNDIITVHTGDIGTSAVIDDNLVGSMGFATIVTRIKDTTMINPNYICWYYNSGVFKREILNLSTGDGRINLNLKDFCRLYIPVPDIEVQNKIVQTLNNVENDLIFTKKKLKKYKKIKEGMMEDLLTGKVRLNYE